MARLNYFKDLKTTAAMLTTETTAIRDATVGFKSVMSNTISNLEDNYNDVEINDQIKNLELDKAFFSSFANEL